MSHQNKINEAIEYGAKSLILALEIKNWEEFERSTRDLHKFYEKTQNYGRAYELIKLNIQEKDSIESEETQKNVMRQEYRYEYEKQKVLDQFKHDEEIARQISDKNRKEKIIYAAIRVSIIVLALLILLFNRFKLAQSQKLVIEETNYELNAMVEELNTANDKYEMLLIESNHRIKNNLQMILSMLEYKAIQSGKRNEDLEKVTSNIKAITALHKHLFLCTLHINFYHYTFATDKNVR